MRNGRSNGIMMYKTNRSRGRRSHPLISSWKFSPVLIAVFISICIVNCASGEESQVTDLPAVATPQVPFPPPPVPAVAPGERSNAGNAQPKTSPSQCDPPRIIEGDKNVFCRSYTTIPTDIREPDQVKVLDMSEGNTIQILRSGELSRSKLVILVNLVLKNCQIHAIERGAFSDGKVVRDLDLSSNKIEVLDPEVFAELISLQRLNLQKNPINRFEVGAVFPPLRSLVTLDLSSGVLDSVPVDVLNNLSSLKKLYLNGNHLRQLDWRVFRNTKVLDFVDLANNHWQCDCHVRFLMEFLRESRLSTSFQQATCTATSRVTSTYIGAKWDTVPIEEMTCPAKIDQLSYDVLERSAVSPPEEQGDVPNDNSGGKDVNLNDDVYFDCEYNGHPKPEIRWLKDNKPIVESKGETVTERTAPRGLANEGGSTNDSISNPAEIKPRIEIHDVTFEITQTMQDDEEKNNYKFKEHLILRRVKAEDTGTYTCIIENAGGTDEKALALKVSGKEYGGLVTGGGNKIWMWILIGLLCVLILILISLLSCLVWRRREKRKQEGFRKVVHEKFKDSNIDLGDFDVKTSSPNSQQSKDPNRVDGATPLLDHRSEASTVLISDLQQNGTPLPDVALGNADLIRNSQIFSPKPPPPHHGYSGDARKEFFARQISEPYLRPASAMSLSRPAALNAAQRRYIFANQPYQSEPVTGFQENLYAVPNQVRDFPRSGSAMSVSALPEYDLRRQMFMRQYSQPQSQYATAARPRRIPSTSSEPPLENMERAFSYSTLPRRPIRLQNWSRPVSPTNSTCSTYSTLSWRPNVDPRTGVISDGMGARNTAHGGSTSSINKIPDMNGSIIGIGDGIESMNRAMLTPSNAGKVKNTRNQRYGPHSRTPTSLTRGHNDFFSFEPIQEVESSECASTLNLDRSEAKQTPAAGYTTQSLARGEPRYKKKKPPPVSVIPNNLKKPSRAFEHLKGRSASPGLRNSVLNGDQPTEQIENMATGAATAPESNNNANAGVPIVQNATIVNTTNNDADINNANIPVLESPIDEVAHPTIILSAKVPPPPPPPKPKRPNQPENEIHTPETVLNGDEASNSNQAEGTVV